MDLKWLIELSIFSLLVFFTILGRERREKIIKKSFDDWVSDLLNLTIQGTIVPILQVYVIFKLLLYAFPSYQSSWELGWTGAIFLNFIVVDYIYYLVHKALHRESLWGLHILHHSVTDFDVFASGRNTIWTTFLFPYIWLNSIFCLFQDAIAVRIGR